MGRHGFDRTSGKKTTRDKLETLTGTEGCVGLNQRRETKSQYLNQVSARPPPGFPPSACAMNQTCLRDNCEACPGRFVCYCLGVTEEAVVEAICSGAVRDVRDLRDSTGAGDGCTACHQRLRSLIERYALTMAPVAAAG